MRLWKKLYNYLKGYDKWIEIKIPNYFKNRENDFFKKDDEEMVNEISQDINEIRKEEE
ncbi:hypothetical protein KY342_05670 [Candidatus Woesearchaeota archaeon]|nr:hypothetical protein [Candidatus Woesearchaeota archaeon]